MLLLLLCILPEDSEARLDKLMQPNSSLFLQTVSLMRSPHCLKSSSVRTVSGGCQDVSHLMEEILLK